MTSNNQVCGFSKLNKKVISSGLCCFCGTCVSACPSDNIAINYKTEEPYQINKSICSRNCHLCWSVCPGKVLQYPQLEKIFLGRERTDSEWELGIYSYLTAGSATETEIREAGTSGGIGTVLLKQALQSKLVGGVVIASTDKLIPWQGIPFYTNNEDSIKRNARSKYVPIPMNAAIKAAIKKYGKIAITALPCQVAGIRKAQINRLKDFQQIEVIIGIACGYCAHASLYEHIISELLGIPLPEVESVEFRGGPYPGEFRVYKKNGLLVSCPSNIRIMMAFSFIRDRCSMCIDWGAELADITLADLFTKQECDESGKRLGNTAVIVRTSSGDKLIKSAEEAGRVSLFPLSQEELSGNIGLEWKKHGFAKHLEIRREKGWPVPDFGIRGSLEPWPRKMHIYNRQET